MNAPHLPQILAFARSDQDQLIAQLQYLTIENQILRGKLPKRISLTKRERRRLIRFGKAVGPSLREIISIVQYTTFQRWLRSNTHKNRRHKAKTGRPPTKRDLKKLVLQMAKTPGWGYTRSPNAVSRSYIGARLNLLTPTNEESHHPYTDNLVGVDQINLLFCVHK